jgi:hypothetical protein
MEKIRTKLKLMLVTGLLLSVVCIICMPVAASANNVAVYRNIPDSINAGPGDTLVITVTFTAPEDAFNSIVLHDEAPAGWQVTVDTGSCTPSVLTGKVIGVNGLEYTWLGPYDAGQTFQAVYRVTIPPGSPESIHTLSGGWLVYYIVSEEHQTGITGDSQVRVTSGPDSAPGGGNTGDDTDDIEDDIDEIIEDNSPTATQPPEPDSEIVPDIEDDGDVFIQDTVQSQDGRAKVAISRGTVRLNVTNPAITEISITPAVQPASPPQGAVIIGQVYNFEPDGMQFEPAIEIIMGYVDSEISAGTGEDRLVIAFWNAEKGIWDTLNSTVDPDKNIVTAYVSHFTMFTILAYQVEPPSAVFTVTGINISPSTATIGTNAIISAVVSNSGSISGVYEAVLKINGVIEDTQELPVAAGQSHPIVFIISPDTAGTLEISVGGLVTTLEVTEISGIEKSESAGIESQQINWLLVGGIGGGIVVILLIILLVRRRYRYY